MKKFLPVILAYIMISSCSLNKAGTKTSPGPEKAVANQPLESTYWMLFELEGKAVAAPGAGEKPSFIYFNAVKKRVGITGGCNVMGGNYELSEGNRIKFGQLITTLMACPDMATEEALKKMTGMVDQYSILGDTLSFSKGRMAPSAKFKAVAAPPGFKMD